MSTLTSLAPHPSGLRIGLDIGGTKTAAAAFDAAGTPHATVRVPTGYAASGVIASSVQAVRGLEAQLNLDGCAVGVGIPGAVDSATGRVRHAVNLGLADFALGEELERALGRRVHVENDVNAAALGIYQMLAPRGVRSLAYLNLGTGVAAGIIWNGRLHRGFAGVAGEIGHIPVTADGAVCACGQRGCIELYASGSGLARMWPEPSSMFADAVRRGDPVANRVNTEMARAIASAVRILVLSVDVAKVVIGGGLTTVGAPLTDELRRVLNAWAGDSPFLHSLGLADRVEILPPDSAAAALGAALGWDQNAYARPSPFDPAVP